MREATIGGLSAMDEIRPRKGAGPSAPKSTAKRARTRDGRMARFRRFRARATLIIGSAGFSAIMIGIVLNATFMQKGHHPAPLFMGAALPAPLAAHAVDPVLAPVVPAPAAEPVPAPLESTVAPQSAVPPVPLMNHAAHGAAPVHAAKTDDPIARLLGGTLPHHAPKPAHPVHPVAKATLAASTHAKATTVALKPKAVPLASAKPAPTAAVN